MQEAKGRKKSQRKSAALSAPVPVDLLDGGPDRRQAVIARSDLLDVVNQTGIARLGYPAPEVPGPLLVRTLQRLERHAALRQLVLELFVLILCGRGGGVGVAEG